MEPGPGVGPVPVGGGPRDSENGGRLLDRQAAEKSEPHELALGRVLVCQGIECLGQIEQIVGREFVDRNGLPEVESLAAAAALAAAPSPGPVDQDMPENLGRNCEKVMAILEVPAWLFCEDAEIGFMDQRGGFKRLPGRFGRQSRRGDSPQFGVDLGELRSRVHAVTPS